MSGVELGVRVMGRLAVFRAGRALATGEVGSRKARTVLAVLAVHGGFVTVDRIADAVWQDRQPHDPVANLATLVSRLRAALGREVVTGGRAGYRLGERVRVDLAEIDDLVAEAETQINTGQLAVALMAARSAAHRLGRDTVLSEHPAADWAEPARVRHAQLLRRARRAMAEAGLRTGNLREANAAAEAAVAADPFDETACRQLMRSHYAAGEPAQAIRTYHRLRVTLATELGVDPAPATRTLQLTILRDGALAAG